jgi:hypothetical protein
MAEPFAYVIFVNPVICEWIQQDQEPGNRRLHSTGVRGGGGGGGGGPVGPVLPTAYDTDFAHFFFVVKICASK